MSIELKNILNAETLKQLSPEIVTSIETSINESVNKKIKDLEKKDAEKFNSLVEDLSEKFNKKVDNVILESVKTKTEETTTKKLKTIIENMTNLLEDAGIPTTEATKKLQMELRSAGDKLKKAYNDVETLKDLYNDQLKLTTIMNETKGMRPEIVDAAIEYFKNKDIREIDKDSIAAFLDGDHSDLINDNKDDINGDLNLDNVKDAINELSNEMDSTSSPYTEKKSKLESLGQGLKPQKALFTPDTNTQMLNESTNLDENMEPDTKEAMHMLDKYNHLGFNSFG